MWNYEGMVVTGSYLGEAVCGRVEMSRVAYGGDVVHTVVLEKPIKLRWRSELTDRVILKHKEIETVRD